MTRLERFSLAAVFAFSLGGRAFAQEPSPTPPPPALPAEVETRPVPVPTPDPRPVLELSLQDAVARALEGNADIAVEKLNPEIDAQTVRQLQGFYDPLLFSTITKNSRTTAATDVFAGGETVDTDSLTYNFGATQELPTGGALRLDFNNSRSTPTARAPTSTPPTTPRCSSSSSSRCCAGSRSTTPATRSRWPSGTARSRTCSSSRRW